ncbi:hypothetical protein NC651_033808 [Populus alba x Populus x berolinensis]|nr:hypothetical protein NC651_033808 [Populus alba x Populus x berolinensis]
MKQRKRLPSLNNGGNGECKCYKSQIKWLGDGNTEVTVEPHHQTLSWLILPRQPTMKGVCNPM